MSRNTSNASTPSDGSWFLQAVGAIPKAPTPSQAIADLTAENAIIDPTPPIEGEMAAAVVQPASASVTFDGDPGTSTSSFHPAPPPPAPPALDRPTEDATPPRHDSRETGDPQLPHALRSRRNFRWPVVIVLVLLIGLVVAAAWWLPQEMEREATAARQTYYDAAADVRVHLPDTQAALDVITDPSSTSDAVSGSIPAIADLDARALALETATTAPLPRVYPLVPSDAVDALVPLQDRGALLGTSSSLLASSLGNAYVYRTSIPLLLQTGSLPTSATTSQVNEISVTLASSLATDAGIVADLPDDPDFAVVAEAAVAALQRYGDWQSEYLESLTSEDAERAGALIAEIERLRADLLATGEATLLTYRTTTDLEIIALASQLEAYMADVSRR